MRPSLVLCAVVLLWAGTAAGVRAEESPYNQRMTQDEREDTFKEMKKRFLRKNKPCIPSTSSPINTKSLPSVPDSFTTKVEIAYEKESQMRVLYGAESYDGVINTGVLRYELAEGVLLTRPYALEEIIHYSIPTDQALIIFTDTACEETGEGNCDPKKTCFARKLEDVSANLDELFGFGDANGENGYYGAGGILQWGPQYNYEYRGIQACRGMTCEMYETCISDPAEEATVHLIYFWSNPDWTVTTSGKQVPIAVEVYATGKYGHLFTRQVIQRYDFYEYYRDIRPDLDELEPPVDVYCIGRVSIYQPPRVPYYFSYSSEAITSFDISLSTGDNQTQRVTFNLVFTHTEYYDWGAKVVVSDFLPWFIFGNQYRYEMEIRRVQDFNQGLVYRILKNSEGCYISPIQNYTSAGDVIVDENGTISLLPPWIFEDLDQPMQYNGVHLVRGVNADTWIGMKKLFNTYIHDAIVWYYGSTLTLDETKIQDQEDIPEEAMRGVVSGLRIGGGTGKEDRKKDPPVIVSYDRVPLRLERYINLIASLPHLIINLYDYQREPPMTQNVDISSCYVPEQMRSFVMDLPLDSLKKVKNLRQDLVYGAMTSLAENGVISPIRINRPVLEASEERMRLLFTVLDKPNVEGDAPGTDLESDMNTAIDLMRAAVDKSQLIIIVHLEEFITSPEERPVAVIVAVPGSMKEVERDEHNNYVKKESKGYESGDMAGLAIGMLIVGALVGVGVCVVLKRRASGQSGLPRVKLAQKSPPNSTSTINFSADMTASDI